MDLTGVSLLLVEDEPALARRLGNVLTKAGAEVTAVTTLQQARQALRGLHFDVILLDINLPDGRGLDLLEGREVPETTPVLVMTAEPGVAGAIEAMRLGAADYLPKPFELEEMLLRLQRTRQQHQGQRREQHQRAVQARSAEFVFTAALQPLRLQLDRILAAERRLQQGVPAPVLIEGETGTGKTSIARWLHQHGPRADRPLIEVNCAAIPETLVESELFGHERGAFTDAKTARLGLFEAAEGGSLFLDELPSLSLACQAKLLKAIEDGVIRRVGGTRDVRIDVRILAASQADLARRVEAGGFRADLMHRLDVFRLRIPPLRERGADLLPLADALVERIARRYGFGELSLPAESRSWLLAYRWPGNVRELAHEIERSIVLEEPKLTFQALRRLIQEPSAQGPSDGVTTLPPSGFSLEQTIDRWVLQALRQAQGNVSAAARLLGVSRDYVRYRLKVRPGLGENSQLDGGAWEE